ncbi:CPBP family glutamic-type intramembrane protease [Pseudodesulfovibrio sp.]|uniref:CPBP family glutamic-type intramembrane protease n=1 Tax=Pseudodesulfovibrio sp. TaxID=2035812 RepID=UPI00260BEF9E|nr:CPBP family glutamic-type intramembrane protease [Pseudodesulfovibrio sp.]MDD3311865.1 CPBP family glutamic-type intramembrane protease [Pseudodesulfovibrio sp.]
MTQTQNTRSVAIFLGLTFAATFGLEAVLIAGGLRFDDPVLRTGPTLWLLAEMWIPGLAALVAVKFVEKRSWRELREDLLLRFGSAGPWVLMLPLAPLLFAAMYGLTWLLGLGAPDPTLATLTTATGAQGLTSDDVFKVMLPMSALVGPLVNFGFGLGEELGWRGFLLPRLLHLGKGRAYLLLGVLWGLWHAPLILAGFDYPGHPVAGVAMMCVLCTAFGVFLGEMTLHFRSVLLAGFIHGAVNAQGYGIWPWLFPSVNPVLGGGSGLTGAAVWLAAGLTAWWWCERRRERDRETAYSGL